MQKEIMVSLQEVVDAFNLTVLYNRKNLQDIKIRIADVSRPGLQLAGFYEHFIPNRIQLIGNMELAYLRSFDLQEQEERLCELFKSGIPCLIVCTEFDVPELIFSCAKKFELPLLKTEEKMASFYSSLVKYLNVELAPRTSIHGVLVEVFGEGVLITGASGLGKSETALELVKRGHRLIADDLVEVRRVSDTTLLGRAPEILQHLIEIRGVGIVDVKELYGVSSIKPQENIELIINMELWQEGKFYNRLGNDEETTRVLGIEVPTISIPIRPGRNLAIIVEVAAINHRQKMMGYDATKELTDKVFAAKLEQKTEQRDRRKRK